MDKALIITSVASMVDQFLLPSILLLQDMGYEVHIACNFEKGNTCSMERVEELKKKLNENKILFYQVDFERNVLQLSKNKRAFGQISNIISANGFKLIHCHSPIGGLLGRLAAIKSRKTGTKVFYTAHGFHFYKGAPLKNWLMYYPVERFCSHFTDVLITINQEDYELAVRKMKAKKIEYVPGVGIDLSRFEGIHVNRSEKRREIGVPEDAFVMLSVGELNENKNHQIIIKALAQLNNKNIHYVIAGVGDKRDYLLDLAKELGVSEQLHLLGYRKDVPELNLSADLFCFPSIREGLSVSVMEAMACGLACVVSKIRGNTDLIDPCGGAYFDPGSFEEAAAAISLVLNEGSAEMSAYNRQKISDFSLQSVIALMERIYEKG